MRKKRKRFQMIASGWFEDGVLFDNSRNYKRPQALVGQDYN